MKWTLTVMSQLRDKTEEFRTRFAKGETLTNLLPEAFAVVREASKRVLGMYPFRVQIMGAAALHEGNIAEMKTGEGKTLNVYFVGLFKCTYQLKVSCCNSQRIFGKS